MTSPLLSRVSRFAGMPVLVVGDLMVDRFLRGAVHRLSPEAPVPVVDVREDKSMPGGAGNVAANIAALGGRPLLVSVVGEDPEGDRLVDALRAVRVDVDGIVADAHRPTIVKTRVIAGHQQVVRFDREDRAPLAPAVLNRLLERMREKMTAARAVILSDYGKGVIGPRLLNAVLTLAHRQKKFVMVDPKVEHFLRYRRVDCITPNLKEATEGLRGLPPKNDAEVDALGGRILRRLRCHSVLITRGERGMSLYREGKPPLHIPSQAREVFDVTGAGDTVISTLSLALAAGANLEDAARLSNAAAGVVVGKLGTATVSPAELLAALRARRP
ncbi:MAG TPA: D-glycero-beta-D-manno-heptose-7-phosphate kinase [Elusimicrobiota bacterium]|nr:D-glycero-beta-D-manno-heptose-7-phosphate kinase [Elusimicrobiota bacterium]HMX93674.1 D-glycero-beta-D-manno-heptose-7-phosphate kinase [Elusimicrobiota bacterium]HMZ26673.1 D-glycero-beta-D-manno-heptose-7-phosphate kinase [Elusimicrobiota bacterium]HNF59593.1 D-glycero-beta-D-manno-heptose-7-phosphate kinase [Elusimicrobiota bacterium]